MRLMACLVVVSVVFVVGREAKADSFSISSLGAGVQTPAGITTNVETFTGDTYNGTSMSTNFHNSGITGTYTGQLALVAADQFGGAGGTGQYITTASVAGNAVYTLTLSSAVNYFGLWFSALDAGNDLEFYKGTRWYSALPPRSTQAWSVSARERADFAATRTESVKTWASNMRT